MRLFLLAARALSTCLIGALMAVWAAQVAADSTLQAPDPTPVVFDSADIFITQAGHSFGPRIEYGYWPIVPPPRVVAATLALEDQRFWWHPGIDPLALVRALWQHIRGGPRLSGASTIAMQVARMQHPRPRTLWAKAVEAGTAVALTWRYGHAAVLAQYLRLAPYGQGSHGMEHAAWWYFGRPAADLDWAQAALLAAIPQSPARLALRRDNPKTLARAALALNRLGQKTDGLATTMQVPAWRRPPCTALVLRLAALARLMPPGASPILHATVDLRLQNELAGLMSSQMRELRNLGAQQAALLVVRRQNGNVLAAIPALPHAPGAAFDFLATPRSPGSAEKPFFYAQALDLGRLHPAEMVRDAPEESPLIANADHAYLGLMAPGDALANSRNVPAAALLGRIGLDAGFAYLRRLGLHDADTPPAAYGLGLAIGALPTTLERLTRAYAALANDGAYRDLTWFQGDEAAPSRPVMTAQTARLVTSYLADPMARLPSFPRYGASEYPLAVALKTGTSQGYRDAWTVAWSRDFLAGAWVGRPDGAPMTGVSGARAAGRLVQSVLLHLHGLSRSDLVAGTLASPPPPQAFASPGSGSGSGLRILTPAADLHIWRNPELPAALNRLILRAAAPAGIRQVTWFVDGRPIATVAPDAALPWEMVPGAHQIELRLPLTRGRSAPVSITVDQ